MSSSFTIVEKQKLFFTHYRSSEEIEAVACYKRERVPLDLDYIYQDKCEDMRGK